MLQVAIIGLIILICVVAMFILYLFFGADGKSIGQSNSSIKTMMSTNRNQTPTKKFLEEESKLDAVIKESKKKKLVSSKLTLEKKLKYASWRIPPIAFVISKILISFSAMFITSRLFDLPIVLASGFLGPIIMNWLLNMFIDRKYKAFDKDYPSFLLNVVSMLKTGMNTITAIEAAAEGLDPDSSVKEEVRLMVERLRFGVSEDRSIGSFGEGIYHPEIELFVQALLLSRQVGGQLSDTLDRLSRQVRKRQHFRLDAQSAVGMQRGSIWVIIGIMLALEGFIYKSSPTLIVGAFEDDVGWLVWQTAIIIILLGIFWIRQVTKLKI